MQTYERIQAAFPGGPNPAVVVDYTLAVDPSGDLLVADWGRGVIYAIRKR